MEVLNQCELMEVSGGLTDWVNVAEMVALGTATDFTYGFITGVANAM
jgi:hypothetical protein